MRRIEQGVRERFTRAFDGARQCLAGLASAGVRASLPTHLLALCLLFTLLVAAAHVTIRQSSAEMLKRDALRTAQAWMQSQSGHLDEFAAALRGGSEPGELARLLAVAPGSGDIVHVMLYDRAGRVRFASDDTPIVAAEHHQLPSEVESGHPAITVHAGNRGSDGRIIAEVLLPVEADGEVLGALCIEIDQSDMRDMILTVLGETAMWLGFILAVAFGVPFLGYLIQLRRKASAERALDYLAHHDTLTQLANRATFQKRLERLLASEVAADRSLAVHHLDLDEFKAVNETHGHGAGDELLRQVAMRLSETLRETDCIARLGGDEFVILQQGIRDREQAEALAARIVQVLTERYEVHGQPVRISASVGVALAPEDSVDAEKLMSCADLALYFAKSSGRSCYRTFEASMHAELQQRRAIEARLRAATEERLFELHYQPFYTTKNRRLAGFEALVRLRDERGAMISPADFIPIAEEIGLIDEIGDFVIEEACRTAASWPEHLKIAINLSPVQFRTGAIAGKLAATCAATGLEPGRLEVEVTEGVLLENTESVSRQLNELRALGVSIVLDDFGTGYSSLSYLWQFSFDKIKIDQSFVRALGKSGNVTDIVAAIVSLGRTLKARILAEGVETEEQAEQLRRMRCDQVQGFLLSRPLTTEHANALALDAAPVQVLPRQAALAG